MCGFVCDCFLVYVLGICCSVISVCSRWLCVVCWLIFSCWLIWVSVICFICVSRNIWCDWGGNVVMIVLRWCSCLVLSRCWFGRGEGLVMVSSCMLFRVFLCWCWCCW